MIGTIQMIEQIPYTLAIIGIDDAIYIAIIMAAVSLAANILLRPDPPEIDPLSDDSANSAGTRGTMAPLLLGHNKLKPIIAYVGNRVSWQKVVGSVPDPDGFWEEDDDVYAERFKESAMHILGVGPTLELTQIIEGGKIIFDQKIRRADHVSGSEFTCTDEDSSVFRIYWGEQDQAVDTDLAELTGVSTRYPYCCYIYWVEKQLGARARWKALDYVLSCSTKGEEADFIDGSASEVSFNAEPKTLIVAGQISFRPAMFSTDSLVEDLEVGDLVHFVVDDVWAQIADRVDQDGGYYFTIDDTNYLYSLTLAQSYAMTATPDGTYAKGVNPALAIRQMLFYNYPHGLSLSSSLFDMTSLNDLIPYFAEGGTEPAPSSIMLKSGRSYQAGISGILTDYGLSMYPDSITGLLTFRLIRAGETPVLLDNSVVALDKVQNTKAYSVLAPQKMVYTFLEASRNFTRSTILVDDDGKAKLTGNPNTKKISLNTPTDIVTASAIASRKEQEVGIDRALKIPVSITEEDLNIGDVVEFASLNGVWRLVTKGTGIDKAYVDMSFMLDAYSVTNLYRTGVSTGTDITDPVAADPYVDVFEGNRYLSPDQAGYYLLRARAHTLITGAWLYRSESDVTAEFSGGSSALSFQTFGALNEGMVESGGVLDTLEITAGGTDFESFWNVSVSDADWRSGKVIAKIGDELVFVKSITVIDPETVQLNDILRGRLGTAASVHSTDDVIGFFYKASVPLVKDTVVSPGDTLFFRTRPYTINQILDIEYVDSVQLDYAGGGFRPLACENLNTLDDTNAWLLGTDVDIRWDYKNATALTGAGIGLSDEPSEQALPEGYFKVTILDGAIIKREELEILSNTFTYTQAMMVVDFGAEPSTFNVEVVEVLNGLTSPVEATTINRV